jgi:hypothetical protein
MTSGKEWNKKKKLLLLIKPMLDLEKDGRNGNLEKLAHVFYKLYTIVIHHVILLSPVRCT